MAGQARRPGSAQQLKAYWVRGKGSAKIRWGQPHDFNRCVDQVGKYLGPRAKGYCANLHHQALGVWPGQEGGKGGRSKRR